MGWFLFMLLVYWLVLLAEKAVLSLTPHELEALQGNPAGGAQRAARLGADVRPPLGALMLARLLLGVGMVVFGTAALLRSGDAVDRFVAGGGYSAGLVWAVLCLALAAGFALLFWGLWRLKTPRTAPWLLQRLSWFIVFWQRLFSPLLREKKSLSPAAPPAPSPSENAPLITGEKREIELLRSIVKFGDTTVKQVMQSRSLVVGIDFRTGFHELLATVREAGFSRLPVYDEDLDNLTGILYVKDLVPHLDKEADFEWQSLIRTDVLLVPESKRVSELLREFKAQKLHMAIVVDEYGGSAGLVTMEDILEEVTGDIRDEFDEEHEHRYRKLDEHNFIFEGAALLNDVCRVTGLAPGTFDAVRAYADTLAGLALELRGDIPPKGAEITWNGYTLTVLAADNRRIHQLKLTLPGA
jgi:CBS domain containing-hemolysin-like protein